MGLEIQKKSKRKLCDWLIQRQDREDLIIVLLLNTKSLEDGKAARIYGP